MRAVLMDHALVVMLVMNLLSAVKKLRNQKSKILLKPSQKNLMNNLMKKIGNESSIKVLLF